MTRVAMVALMGLGLLACASAAASYDMSNNPDFQAPCAAATVTAPTCPSPVPSPCQACQNKVYDGPHTEWPGAPDCNAKPVIPVPVADVNPCNPEVDSPQCLPPQHDPSDDYALVVGPCAQAAAYSTPSYGTPSYTPSCPSPAYKPPACAQPQPPACSAPSYTAPAPSYSQPSCSTPSYQTQSCGVTVAPCKLPEAPVEGCGPDGFFPDHASIEDMKVRAQVCRSKQAFDYTNWAFYKGYKKICCTYCSVTGSDEPICSANVGTGCNQVPRWACDDSTPEIVVLKPTPPPPSKAYKWPVDTYTAAKPQTPCEQATAYKASAGSAPASGNGY